MLSSAFENGRPVGLLTGTTLWGVVADLEELLSRHRRLWMLIEDPALLYRLDLIDLAAPIFHLVPAALDVVEINLFLPSSVTVVLFPLLFEALRLLLTALHLP